LRTKLYLVEGAEMPASFYKYLYHATQEQAQFRLWKENNIDTKHIVGKPFPDQFIDDIKFGLQDAMQRYNQTRQIFDILAAVKRTAIPHHATFLGWSLNGVDASPKNA